MQKPWVMTLSNSAPRAEGIITCLHCMRPPFDPGPPCGRDKYRESGIMDGAGMVKSEKGVEEENASNVDNSEG